VVFVRKRTAILAIVLISALLLGAGLSGTQAYEGPLSKKKIASYSDIKFKLDNFHKIERGMTQEEVLQLLGMPLKIKEEHRRHNRWTVHYFYPDGYVVNFKNGLVVGKK
jgi:outer membrane protein assembly factor BamE (lipoprotein component of BamABCDE complex)